MLARKLYASAAALASIGEGAAKRGAPVIGQALQLLISNPNMATAQAAGTMVYESILTGARQRPDLEPLEQLEELLSCGMTYAFYFVEPLASCMCVGAIESAFAARIRLTQVRSCCTHTLILLRACRVQIPGHGHHHVRRGSEHVHVPAPSNLSV